ncbi:MULTISPECIES: lysophospholipid acyltransferase family protein [unclassified Thioalkalivibrio]|uniref:LpxL/LpxP family acyltransferase n=1 Tax=unclassified Thioalkalivibrio TaxID=2621013 RepID=UPI00037FE8FE|nr:MULTISPECIES: lysophospholipid acyltransferase family protein [unclassified Thioalkalivibrio]
MSEPAGETRSGHEAGAYRAPLTARHFAPRYWGSWLLLGVVWVLQEMPRPAVHALARGLGRLIRKGAGRSRAVVERNLELCFPEMTPAEREKRMEAYYRYQAQTVLDYGLLWFGKPGQHAARIRVEGLEHYERLQAAGTPVIILAPHSLALDYGGVRMSQMYDGVSFAKPMKNPVLEWINHRSRTRYSGDIFAREQGLRPAIRQLRRGRFFYYLPDEDLGAEGAVFVDFFGVPKATLTALGRLARMSKAAVLPSFVWYDSVADQYVMRLWPPLEGFPSGDDHADTRQMNQAIERGVTQAPAQYLWSMRLFRTRPEGEPPLYPSRKR